ncbi:PepSY domain-containing protein [Azonexus sp.]|jgi:hypothetical protein|uniref:PepSY domain-containing protein n=1 Tax=Azonexus sp. TaxID=1872668 RepID=UPI0027BAB609|nr:PepSY domain-containing protein [Azonexus sp.]
MRISTQMFSFALFAGLLAGGLMLFQPASANDDRVGAWLPIPRLIEKLEAAGYRNIEKIEREHGRYEVRATNRQGERSKLRLDARTGELLGAQRRDGEGASGRHEARNAGRAEGSGECNKRRCRDDMPAAPAGSR